MNDQVKGSINDSHIFSVLVWRYINIRNADLVIDLGDWTAATDGARKTTSGRTTATEGQRPAPRDPRGRPKALCLQRTPSTDPRRNNIVYEMITTTAAATTTMLPPIVFHPIA